MPVGILLRRVGQIAYGVDTKPIVVAVRCVGIVELYGLQQLVDGSRTLQSESAADVIGQELDTVGYDGRVDAVGGVHLGIECAVVQSFRKAESNFALAAFQIHDYTGG